MNDDLSGLPAELRHPEQVRRVHPTNAFIRFETEETEQSIPQRFEQQVSCYPERLAVKTRDHQLSYAALNKVANRVARALLAQCGERAESIALLLEHDASMIAAILGVLKAGKVYVPLDPSFPYARNAYILEDSQAGLIVTNNENRSLAESLSENGHSLIDIDEIDATLSDENVDLSISADNLANIIYTSGSTGQPKGVVQNHRNLLNVAMRYTNGLSISAEDRLTLLQSYSVAGSVSNMLGALLNGASLFPFNVKEEGLTRLADWLIEEEITVYHSVPAVFRQFANTLTGEEEFPELRLVRLGGEPVQPEDVQLHEKYFPSDSVFVNSYGASEAPSVLRYCVDKDTETSSAVVPVGYPLGDVEILSLDDAGKAVGFDQIGEIAIKSRYISPGYWQKPDLTRATFITDPQDEGKRIYRTGDLGYVQPDGCLVVTGRNDFRVKIRGFRIEVAEIELALRGLTEIKEAAVVAREDQRGEKELVAYIVPQPGQVPTISELRDFLKDKLPDYMVPSAFVVLDTLPLTPNGKLDRLALPAPGLARPELDTNFVEPRTAVEEPLASIWEEVLGLERVGVHDDFFELGGHSLLATRVVSRVREVFQVEMPLLSLFEEPTIAGLAERIEEARRGAQGLTAPPLVPASREAQLPLSFSQQRMWLLDQLEPDTPTYNISHALRLSGALDIEALKRSLEEIVSRHEALRTTFAAVDGEPVQVISTLTDVELPIEDLAALPEAEREAEAKRLARQEARSPFDLERGPLFRAKLLRLGGEEHLLLLTMHHIVSDGWSMGVFWRELGALYGAFSRGEPSPLSELPIQYADYALWQRQRLTGEVLDSQLTYWKERLADIPNLDLPTDRPRPAVQTHRGAHHSLMLPESLTEALKELSRQEGTTLFMVLLGAFQALLARYSGQEDIAVGTPMAGRTHAETEGLIGFFVNTLVMRTDLSGDPTFREVLSRVREVALGAYDHQELPFEKLVQELKPERDLSRAPLFQAFLNMQNVPAARVELPGLTMERLPSPDAEAKFDLTLYAREHDGEVRLELVYNADLFDRVRMVEMLQQLNCLLAQIVENPQSTIASYSLVTPQARSLLPDPEVGVPEPTYEPVTTAFLSWAERAPRQSAVRQGEQIWSYGELAASSHALARYLLAQGTERGDVVALLGPRSFGLIAGMMAVLSSGGVFLTVDRNLPVSRQRLMLQKAGAKHVLFIGERRPEDGWVQELPSLAITSVASNTGRVIEQQGVADQETIDLPELAPDDPAYIFFTSGTTGNPKGILGCHKGLSHFLAWQRETFAVGSQDRCAQLTSLTFDPLLRDIFLPLTSGATLCLPEEDSVLSADRVIPWLERERISLLHTVPALAQSWLSHLPAGISLRALRYVFFAGESLSEALLNRWREAFPEAGGIVNLYGPTETTMAKCFFRVPSPPSQGVQPVGWPLPQTQALILSRNGRPCGIGEPGEIVIRTPFRTLGYIGSEHEVGQQHFVRNPFRDDEGDILYYTGDRGRYRTDGALEYLGRLDHQVKIRGVRVEPGEIQAVLSRHPAVRENVVVARDDVAGGAPAQLKRLVAYIVPDHEHAPLVSELRSYLRERLPEYMVPSSFVALEELPLTSNGKVDRRALPAPDPSGFRAETDFVGPRDALEEDLVGIWEEVLGVERVGVHDDFFELGGHSLRATRVVSRVREVVGVELPLLSLFEEPTLAGLAERIRVMQQSHSASSTVALGSDNLEELRF